MIAINCALSIKYKADIQKKFTTKNNTLLMGLRRVIIIIADATASAEKSQTIIFSNVNCIF